MPYLKREIKSSCFPSFDNARPHDFIDLAKKRAFIRTITVIQKMLKYAIVYYISDFVFLVLFFIDTDEMKTHETQAV